jgi:putative PIN family toxin of toxin-antitoxin system
VPSRRFHGLRPLLVEEGPSHSVATTDQPRVPRVVVDTNVLVSALLGPGRVPDRLLALLSERKVSLGYDARIRAEYEEVTARPKFRSVPPERLQLLLMKLASLGSELSNVAPFVGVLSDESDRAFIEVAIASQADLLITGNVKDFPLTCGFLVLPPASALAQLSDGWPLGR